MHELIVLNDGRFSRLGKTPARITRRMEFKTRPLGVVLADLINWRGARSEAGHMVSTRDKADVSGIVNLG